MFRNLRRWMSASAVIALSASLALTACNSDGTDGDDLRIAPRAAASKGPLSAAALATFTQYTGSTAGRATGAPIRVGFINTETGAGSFPEYSVAMKDAVRLLNEQLGGVKGRPIELDLCHPGDAAQAEQCAQRFAADPSVLAVMHGALDSDTTAFHRVLSPRLPVLGGLPLQPADAQATNSYYFSSGQFGALGVVTYARQYARAEKVALLTTEGFAATERAVSAIRTGLEAAGIRATVARYPANSTDLTEPINASGAGTADLFIPVVTDAAHCVNIHNALQQLRINTQVLTLAGCLSQEVRSKLGDYPRWNYMTFNVSAEAGSIDDSTAWQLRAFKEWFPPLAAQGVPSTAGVMMLQMTLVVARVLGSLPAENLTPASVGAQFKRFGGPVFLGVPRLVFGGIPGLPAIGSLSSRVYNYVGNDDWRDTTAGTWLEPPVAPPSSGSSGRPSSSASNR
jgi:branched-chain amino acid transport system substrate-binding protein